jgi:PKD domain
MHSSFKQRMILAIAFALVIPAIFFGYFASQTPSVKASALFQSPLPTPPNDNFEAAQPLTLDVFSGTDITYATLQEGEPSSCAFGSGTQSIWYAYTPTVSQSLIARLETSGGSSVVGVYSGTALNNLSPIQCIYSWNQGSFLAQAGVTYYFQIVDLYSSNSFVNLKLSVTPPPVANFSYYPPPYFGEPSIYDFVQFYDNSYDPGNVGFQSGTWDFGDGSSSSEYNPYHQYAADGDYTVGHTITTYDGRTGSTSQVVKIRTRDVYITKMARPNSASVGQTKRLIVSVASKPYAQTVAVYLQKSVPGGYQQVAYSEQSIPANRTVDYYFGYTFTPADAQLGKVTFRAEAVMVNGRDAFPADNTFISLPVTVSARGGKGVDASADSDDLSQYTTDETSNQAADGPVLSESGAQTSETTKEGGQSLYHIYMPLIEQ